MTYTVVGLFPNNQDAERASEKLDNAGFEKENIDVSPYRTEGDYASDDYDYDEDSNTGSFWDRLFGDDDRTRRTYSYAGTKSNIVTVYTEDADRAEKAREIMDDAGAISVDDHVPAGYADRTSGTAYTAGRTDRDIVDTDVNRVADYDNDRDFNNTGDKIQVVKEELNVGKEEVQSGGVRIKSRIIEKPIEENVRLRQERVYVKRQPVDKPITDADSAFNESSIEMTERREVPVVDKTARVVEEIKIGKEVTSNEETISDTVRETQVDVENLEGDSRIADRNIDRDLDADNRI